MRIERNTWTYAKNSAGGAGHALLHPLPRLCGGEGRVRGILHAAGLNPPSPCPLPPQSRGERVLGKALAVGCALTLALLFGLGNYAVAQDKKPAAKSPPIAIVGADIYTITKGIIKNGTILIQDGKILRVGTDIPIPDGAIRIDAKGKIVTPGFVTVSATNVALRGAGGAGGGPQPGASIGTTGKLADSLNPLDRNILFCLASGITTACVDVSAGGAGRFGRDGDDDPPPTSVCPCCGMTFLPTEPIGPIAPAARTARRHAVLKMTFGDMAPMMVKESPFYHLPAGSFVGALNRHQWRETIKRAKLQVKDNAGAADDGFDMPDAGGGAGGFGRGIAPEVLSLVQKKIPLRTDAASVEQMRDMIVLAKELDYNLVLEGVQEAWLIPGELKTANVQTILTPRNRRRPTPGKEESTGSSIETSGLLAKAGVPFAVAPLGTAVSLDGIPGRDLTSLPLEAAFAVRGGASEQTALESLTITPAKMLGLDKRLGSIEEGKDADLLILDGNPLDYRTYVEQALVGGKVYYDRARDRIYPDGPKR
jgi:imidazolonepropionase-like amidohydrolase